MTAPLAVVNLGRRRYGEVLELQRAACAARRSGALPHDLLLLVEHEPVVTLGRGTRVTSLPIPVENLRAAGLEVHDVERGGDVTYHGPGQLTGYPILDLTRHREDLHWYLRTLEDGLITGLATLGVQGARRAGLTGVWVDDRKIASIGVHVRRWVTLHGFALNVTVEPSAFGVIVPCGIHGVTMTSIAREVVRPEAPETLWRWSLGAARDAVAAAFGLTPLPWTEELLLAAVHSREMSPDGG